MIGGLRDPARARRGHSLGVDVKVRPLRRLRTDIRASSFPDLSLYERQVVIRAGLVKSACLRGESDQARWAQALVVSVEVITADASTADRVVGLRPDASVFVGPELLAQVGPQAAHMA